MAVRKEIIVLCGGGHKGIVKLSSVAGKENTVRVNCSLDFRPTGTALYIVGDNVAKMILDSANCEAEVPFCANDEVGCVVRSSSLTMFGGNGAKSIMLKKIEDFNRTQKGEHSHSVNLRNEQSYKTDLANDVSHGADSRVDNRESYALSGECKFDADEDCASIAAHACSEDASMRMPEGNGVSNKRSRTCDMDGSNGGTAVFGEWAKYDGNNFYYAVKPQIDEMFICYPEEKLLAETVPNSKWVRIDAVDGCYVVGVLYDEDEPSFICYGVPQQASASERTVPEELENMCVWLPLAHGDATGYWMIYQSAKTGEIIK